MNNNLKTLLLGGAAIGALGLAYYQLMVKPSKHMEAPKTEHKDEKPLEEAKKEESKPADEVKKDESKDEKPLEEVKKEESKPANEVKKDEKSAEEAKKEESKADSKDAKPAEETKAYTNDSVAAKIEDLKIDVTIADVKKAAELLPRQMREVPFETIYPILVRQAVDLAILDNQAKKEGFAEKTEIKNSIEERKRAVLVAAYLEKEVDAKISEETLKKKYEDLKKMIPADEKEYEVAHILFKSEAEAKKTIKEIQDGKLTFEAALEKSLDEKTKKDGGKIGFVKKMELAPELAEKVHATTDGQVVSAPLNFGKTGSSVLKVLSRRPVTAPEFNKVKNELKKAMMPELSMEVMKSIKSAAELKLFGLDGKEIPERTEEELKKSLEANTPSSVDANTLAPTFVCAKFKGGEIQLKDVKAAYEALPEMLRILPFEKMYELVLIKASQERIISDAAEKSGLSKEQKVKDQVALEGRMVVQDAYLKEKAEKMITDTDLKTDYERIKKNLADKNEMEYSLRHIMVASEEEAKKLLKDIKSGKEFDSFLPSSLDDSTKDRKGDLGYVRKRLLPKEAAEAVSKGVKGTVINKVIKLGDDKFSVMRLEDSRPVTPPSFEQMKDQLKAGLIAKKAVQVLEDSRSKVKVTYESLKGLPSSEELEKMFKKINEQMNEVLKSGNMPMPAGTPQ